MVKIRDWRKKAVTQLTALNNDSPQADADVIISAVCGIKKHEIILGDLELCDDDLKKLDEALKRLLQGEPVQYIAGRCEFMSLEFEVNRDTLIPRADTEVLVETVMSLCGDKKVNILDIGCGSGCIAVSLAYYLKNASVVSIDISDGALSVAKRNAKHCGVENKINFLHHDIMSGFLKCDADFDIVVSNPPYIPYDDIKTLKKKVKAFEPETALCGGKDGLDFYRQITDCVRLKDGGCLAFEVGINQAESVAALMKNNFTNIKTVKDLAGIDRVVVGKYNNLKD